MQKGQWAVDGSSASLCLAGRPRRLSLRERWLSGEPYEQASFEFLWSCADGSAVIGVGNFPEYCVAIAGLDAARVADGYVAVDLAMNQEDWDSRGCNGIFWRNLLHIEPVLRST